MQGSRDDRQTYTQIDMLLLLMYMADSKHEGMRSVQAIGHDEVACQPPTLHAEAVSYSCSRSL